MIDLKTVENLAELSKIELAEDEKEKIRKDLDSIIDYVSMLKEAPVSGASSVPDPHINILREDKGPHGSAIYTEKILDCAPKVEDNYVVVKQVIEEKGKK